MLLDWADEHPVGATCALAVVVFVGLHAWGVVHDGPLLLARADPQKRIEIYGQLAATAVAVLGISLTVLAILVALPERPAVAEIRRSDTWPRLQGLLLTIALLALICVLAPTSAARSTTARGAANGSSRFCSHAPWSESLPWWSPASPSG